MILDFSITLEFKRFLFNLVLFYYIFFHYIFYCFNSTLLHFFIIKFERIKHNFFFVIKGEKTVHIRLQLLLLRRQGAYLHEAGKRRSVQSRSGHMPLSCEPDIGIHSNRHSAESQRQGLPVYF